MQMFFVSIFTFPQSKSKPMKMNVTCIRLSKSVRQRFTHPAWTSLVWVRFGHTGDVWEKPPSSCIMGHVGPSVCERAHPSHSTPTFCDAELTEARCCHSEAVRVLLLLWFLISTKLLQSNSRYYTTVFTGWNSAQHDEQIDPWFSASIGRSVSAQRSLYVG